MVAPGHIGYVHQANMLNVLLQLLDQVAFRDLFVKEVVQELDLRDG